MNLYIASFVCDSLHTRLQKDDNIHQVNFLHQLLQDEKDHYSSDFYGNITAIENKDGWSLFFYDRSIEIACRLAFLW